MFSVEGRPEEPVAATFPESRQSVFLVDMLNNRQHIRAVRVRVIIIAVIVGMRLFLALETYGDETKWHRDRTARHAGDEPEAELFRGRENYCR